MLISLYTEVNFIPQTQDSHLSVWITERKVERRKIIELFSKYLNNFPSIFLSILCKSKKHRKDKQIIRYNVQALVVSTFNIEYCYPLIM